MRIPGLAVPPLTPYTRRQEVDWELLRRSVDYVVSDCEAEMVIAAGVEAQEYQYLEVDERRELARRTLEFTRGRRPVAVGVSHPSFRRAVELAQDAEAHGAACLQVLAPRRPFGGEPALKETVAYFRAIIRETSLPIMLYLNPGPGADLSVEATVELAAMDRVDYIKESSRNLARVSRLIGEIEQPGLAAYLTTLEMLLISLQLGGSGGTLPPPAAKLGHQVLEAFKAGDITEAARLQAELSAFPAQWKHRGLPVVMKAAMAELGVPLGDPHPPYRPLTAGERRQLRKALEATSLLRSAQGA